jgi:cytochrome c
VRFKDGSAFEYPEFNLRFKTDSSPNGPKGGTPVQISAGMRGDRAYLVFSGPQEISSFLKNCISQEKS